MKILIFLHLVAMAFFIGGQLMLALVVLPVARELPDREPVRLVARRFGYGTLIALGVLLITGSLMATHEHLWDSPTLHTKLTLVALTGLFVVWHMKRPNKHVLESAIFLVSLAVVWLGISL